MLIGARLDSGSRRLPDGGYRGTGSAVEIPPAGQRDIRELRLSALLQVRSLSPSFPPLLDLTSIPTFSNAFEDVTKLLAQNSYPQPGSPLLPKHLLCMDALLSVVDAVFSNCQAREVARLQQQQQLYQVTPPTRPTRETAMRREMKRLINVGTHLFNENAKDGVEFLFQKGVFSSAAQVVEWFRMSEKLDRTQVAKYLCRLVI